MATKQPSKVLDGSIRNFLERYESALSEAIDGVSERFAEKIEPLVEEFGAPAVDTAIRYYAVTVSVPKNLQEAFGFIVSDPWQDE
jgi:hypothetical protein